MLQKILAEQGAADPDDGKIHTRTAELKTHSERMAFQKLVGLPPYSDLTNAVAILIGGLERAGRLMSVKTTSATPLPNGETIISTRDAQRRLFFMNQHGICFTVDSQLLIAVDKLEDAKFFATEEDLDAAGVARWGENGTGRWRVLVAPIGEEICGLFEFGEMTSLGKRPEGRINELSMWGKLHHV
nr:hypothetical protein [Providencia heimbachae]